LLATGCEAQLRIAVDVRRDGAGTLAVTLGADAELLEQTRAAGVDPLDALAGVGAELAAEGWQVSEATDAVGARTVTLRASFGSPAAFDALAGQLAGALAAPEVTPLEGLRLELTEDTVVVSGSAGLVPTSEVAALGVQPEQAVAILEETDALGYEITVTMPGSALVTTAPGQEDAPAGEPLVWRIAPGEQVEILAVSERPGGLWWVLALAGALGGLAALAGLAALRRVLASRRPDRAR
jgi:hypothetical protein